MRLAVFTNQFPGRVSTFFARDMRALIESGVEVDVFPVYPLDETLWPCVPEILNESVFAKSQLRHVSMTEILRLPRKRILSQAGRFCRDMLAISASALKYGAGPTAKSIYVFLKSWALAQQFRTDYDHVLAYWGSYAATYAYLVHRLTDSRIPYSVFLHAGDLYQDQVMLERKLLYADNIFVVCEFNRQYLAEHYPTVFDTISKKIQVYHLGLDLAEFPYEQRRLGSRTILGVGRFDKCKGFDFLIRAIHLLDRKGIEVQLALIGEGEEANSLKALASRLGIKKLVKFYGWLPFDEVRSAMREASLLVHPSSELGDAVPTVIKEACALGTPVIGTNVAGIPELLGDGTCGILVPPKDTEALATAIEFLLTDEPARRRYTEAARKHAEEKFDLWRNGRKLADTLQVTKRLSAHTTTPSTAGRAPAQLIH